MIKCILTDTEVMRIPLPSEFKEDFENLISFQRSPVGAFGTDFGAYSDRDVCDLELPHSFSRSVFNSSEMDQPMQLFTILHLLIVELTVRISSTPLLWCEKVFGSFKGQSKNSNIILAQLSGENRPAKINYFAKVSVLVDGTSNIHLVVSNWFKHDVQKNVCGEPVTVLELDLFHLCVFMPAQHIKCRTVSFVDKLDDVFGNTIVCLTLPITVHFYPLLVFCQNLNCYLTPSI